MNKQKKMIGASVIWALGGILMLAASGFVGMPGAVAQVPVLGTSGQRVNVEIHQGALVRLASPADAVFMANTEIADLTVHSPTLVYVRGVSAGTTTLFAVGANDDVIASAEIVVSHNVSELRAALDLVAPGSQIEATTIGVNLILSGTALSPQHARNALELATGLTQNEEDDGVIINQMTVSGPNQVNLRVRIAEISRDTVKRLGFNFDFLATSGDIAVGVASGGLVSSFLSGATGILGDNTALAAFDSGDISADAIIDALEEENLLRILAEPNLTTVSGETASFLAGGEFPIPVPQEGGAISIEFRSFGVSLSFTPTILDNGRISMRVRPEVSTLSSAGSVTLGGFVIPALSVRRSETTVELASGQSMAIAGLLQSDINENVAEFPGLADIPILGTLFRSSNFEQNETELMILVTPYLVRPVSTVALADPTQGFRVPTDHERVVEGRVYDERVPSARRALVNGESQGLIGPVGFVLD